MDNDTDSGYQLGQIIHMPNGKREVVTMILHINRPIIETAEHGKARIKSKIPPTMIRYSVIITEPIHGST